MKRYGLIFGLALAVTGVSFQVRGLPEVSASDRPRRVFIEKECPICFEVFSKSDRPVMALGCGHMLHQDCLEEYQERFKNCLTCDEPIRLEPFTPEERAPEPSAPPMPSLHELWNSCFGAEEIKTLTLAQLEKVFFSIPTEEERQRFLFLTPERGRTGLLKAACWGYLDVIKFMLAQVHDAEKRDRLIMMMDMNGETALMKAIGGKKLHVAQFLVSKIINPRNKIKFLTHENIKGATALLFAASRGYYAMVRFIVAQINNINKIKKLIVMESTIGHTALSRAKDNGHIEVIAYLESIIAQG